MSAKRPVPFLRQVVPVRKKVGAAPPQFMTSLSAAARAHLGMGLLQMAQAASGGQGWTTGDCRQCFLRENNGWVAAAAG